MPTERDSKTDRPTVGVGRAARPRCFQDGPQHARRHTQVIVFRENEAPMTIFIQAVTKSAVQPQVMLCATVVCIRACVLHEMNTAKLMPPGTYTSAHIPLWCVISHDIRTAIQRIRMLVGVHISAQQELYECCA